MTDETHRVKIENLPRTDSEALRVELVPMPTRDPWRTRGEYLREQRRDSVRFWVTIASLLVAIIGVAATTWTAIHTIRQTAGSESFSSKSAAPR